MAAAVTASLYVVTDAGVLLKTAAPKKQGFMHCKRDQNKKVVPEKMDQSSQTGSKTSLVAASELAQSASDKKETEPLTNASEVALIQQDPILKEMAMTQSQEGVYIKGRRKVRPVTSYTIPGGYPL